MKKALSILVSTAAFSLALAAPASASGGHNSFDYYGWITKTYKSKNFTTGGSDRRVDVESYGVTTSSTGKDYTLRIYSANTGSWLGATKSCSKSCHVHWDNIPKGTYYLVQTITYSVAGQTYYVGGTVGPYGVN